MIIPINETSRPEILQRVQDEWAGPMIVTRGVAHDISDKKGFAAFEDGNMVGYVMYCVDGDQCEILVLESIVENRGIGSALIRTVVNAARERHCKRVWLITTNDNTHAIRFYQKFGFDLKAVHIHAIDESRRIKPTLPLVGIDNIPIKHEFEFEYDLLVKE